ncbi:MAG: rRNA maturation RNase YbeY [Candidatus Eisenbacteria bacterium]
MEVYSENLQRNVEVDTESFRGTAERILTSLVGPSGEASVVFVSDDRIRELNRDYRKIDLPTDVLSFSCYNDEMSGGVIGDVFISVETAGRQAAERGVSLEEELTRLMIHGLLHLVGHTHDGEEDGGRMRELEEKLYAAHRIGTAGGEPTGEG